VLAELGLTEYEAKAYLALLTESPLSGYSIARNSGVPRSKIYEVLGSLVGKGAVLASHGDPVRYAPLSPKELLTRYRGEMEQVLDWAESTLGRYAAQQQAGALIWDVQVGRLAPEIVGADLKDGTGQSHAGITTVPIPVLKSDAARLTDLRGRAGLVDGVVIVDVTNVGQTSKTYDEYADRLGAATAEQLTYLGLAPHGEHRAVTRLTGSLPLLR